jgi:hypothetical protein
MPKPVSIFCLLLFPGCLMAQEFGGNPPFIKWKQINTDTARVIFPVGNDSAAQRVSSVVHFLAAKNNLLGNKHNKINIVLQNQTTVANAYVSLGPYRSEFYLTPPFNNFDLGSIPWTDGLATHEFRHVQQFSNFRTGLSKAMYYLFGEEGLAVAINASVPDWFYEGDAVYNETVHTQQGRGRIPFFTNQYRSLWLDNKNYSWMKLRNGSLKDYIPNHYPLGYLLVNYGYEKYGSDFWRKVTTEAAAFKGLFYPFQQAIKEHAGVDYKTFRKQAIDHYKTKSQEGNAAVEQKISNPTLSHVTNYFFPYQMDDGSLLFLKNSYRKRPAFVIKDNSGEHVIRIKDISLDEHFSYRNGRVVYSAFKPDIRWGWTNYGELRVLDIRTGTQRKISLKTKYFTPDINNDGTRIAAVHYGEDGKCQLHVLDASGSVLQRIESAEITVFTDPKFINDNSMVACARLRTGQMALVRCEMNGAVTRITPPSYHVLGFPNVQGDKVYFTASLNGNDDLFLVQLSDKKIFQISNSSTGNYFASASANKIVYSSFTADGYQLKAIDLNNAQLNEISESAFQSSPNRYPVAKENEFRSQLITDIPSRNYPVSKYSKATKLFNFHSWRPYYEDPVFTYTLYGENVLNTLQTEVYYSYNQDDRTSAAGLSTTYGGFFPYLSAGTEYTFKRTDTLNGITRQWNQLDTRVGLSFPLNFSGGRFFRSLNFGSSYVFRIENNTGPTKDLFTENNFSYLSHFVTYSQQVPMARQHIFPRLGFNFSLRYRDAISKYDSHQFFTTANLYLPGFLATHSLVLNGSVQERDTSRALFSDLFADARGFSSYYYTNAGSKMWRLSANYHLPLLLPDWGFGNIVYFHRIRANLFYDFQRVFSDNKKITADLSSTGFEMYFDTNWWNQYPLTFGFRISHLLDADLLTRTKGTYFEFIVPVVIPR